MIIGHLLRSLEFPLSRGDAASEAKVVVVLVGA
jgi:hypothetical protein